MEYARVHARVSVTNTEKYAHFADKLPANLEIPNKSSIFAAVF